MDRRFLANDTNRDTGFVLVTALMVIFLVVSIVLTVTLITASDLRSSARARAIIETRLMSESVSDAIFASIARSSSSYVDTANSSFAVNPTLGISNATNNPLHPSLGNPSTLNYGNWFRLKPGGGLELCDGVYRKDPCFRARLKHIPPVEGTLTTPAQRESLRLEIIARGGCIATGGTGENDVAKCIYRKYVQVFRTRAYVEDVLLTETEAASPVVGTVPDLGSGPVNVSYVASDQLDGTFYNNQGAQQVCGTPNISGTTKFKNSANLLQSIVPLASSCGTVPLSTDFFAGEKFIPTQFDKRGATVASNTVFRALAGDSYSFNGSVSIELRSDGVMFGSDFKAYPSNGVIFVDGEITSLFGTYSRSLTIAATGNITIMGDITYMDSNGIVQNGDIQPNSSDPVFGVTTSGDILINCPIVINGCQSRSIVGILSAPSGTIYNPDWASSAAATDPVNPTRIRLRGAIVAFYKPVFGSFSSGTNGMVNKGWAKTLRFDKRLPDLQPPYFFRTTQATIVRSSIEGSGCIDGGNPGQPTC